ncbi:MAG: hypothetical protein LBH13_06070 [Cellulomonadaceae bacterium]|jgi:hypothetical protein|nr:hypothetical protein [Cellulomonadaceae bacterium]
MMTEHLNEFPPVESMLPVEAMPSVEPDLVSVSKPRHHAPATHTAAPTLRRSSLRRRLVTVSLSAALALAGMSGMRADAITDTTPDTATLTTGCIDTATVPKVNINGGACQSGYNGSNMIAISSGGQPWAMHWDTSQNSVNRIDHYLVTFSTNSGGSSSLTWQTNANGDGTKWRLTGTNGSGSSQSGSGLKLWDNTTTSHGGSTDANMSFVPMSQSPAVSTAGSTTINLNPTVTGIAWGVNYASGLTGSHKASGTVSVVAVGPGGWQSPPVTATFSATLSGVLGVITVSASCTMAP